MAFSDQQKKWVMIGIFVALLALSLYIIKPYLSALLVGALLAYFLSPLYKWIQSKVKSTVVTQILVGLFGLVILLVLFAGLVLPLAEQVQDLSQRTEHYINLYVGDHDCREGFLCDATKELKTDLRSEGFTQKSGELLQTAGSLFFKSISDVISGFVSAIIFLVIMVFATFYFLQHGREFKETLLETIPLKKAYKHRIYDRLKQTINAVVGGNISTALLQGFFGGVIFALLGLPLPLFWGLIMAILAFIPAVGAALIWIPAAIILFIQGSIVKAIILIIFSVVVLRYVDNFLNPKSIGNKIKLSSFAIFLGVLGGLQVFGILGLFFGPIILALFTTTVQIYREMS